MKNKSPAFQFYPEAYLSDANTIVMTAEQDGHYLRLLCLCWLEGSIPANIEDLKPLLKITSTNIEQALKGVLRCFHPDPDDPSRLRHKRLDKERLKQKNRSRQCSKAGKKSQSNKRDRGISKRSTNVEQSTETNVEPSVCVSGSVSNSKPKTPIGQKDPSAPDWDNRFEIIWGEYPRKLKKHEAKLKFKKQVQTEQDWLDIQEALKNYIIDTEHIRANGHPDREWQHGSTWFNHVWRDYIQIEPQKLRGPGSRFITQANINSAAPGKLVI